MLTNQVIVIKIEQRLNKISSKDYDNVEKWQMIEAFNKAQSDWCRRNLHGTNLLKEGDEQSTSRIDDLQVLLTTWSPVLSQKPDCFITENLPANYLRWKRVSVQAVNECCTSSRPMVVYLTEEGNKDIHMRDNNTRPSFDWGETFATVKNNQISIYTAGEFTLVKPEIIYYRQPRKIQMQGIQDPYTGIIANTDVICEFKDDLAELFIDEAVKIISGDIESLNQVQIETKQAEENN